MKRLIFILLFSLIVPQGILFAESLEGTYFVNFKWLNVRGGPGLSFPIVEKLEKNEEVHVLVIEKHEWYKIEFRKGKTGYAHKKYLTKRASQLPVNVPKIDPVVTPPAPELEELPENVIISNFESTVSESEVNQAEKEVLIDIFDKQDALRDIRVSFIKKPFSVNGIDTTESFMEYPHEYLVDFAWLNVRSGPGLFYDKLGELEFGQTIIVEKVIENQWAEFSFDDGKGYVYVKYLKKTGEENPDIQSLFEFVHQVVQLPLFYR